MATDWASLVQESEHEIKRQRETAPNPLAGVIKASWGDGSQPKPLKVAVTNKDEVKAVQGFLRRDARESDLGVSIQLRDGRGKLVTDAAKAKTVHFQATVKKQHSYTAADVRAWATEQGHTLPEKGRVPKEITQAYRAAHGLNGKAADATE